MAMGLFPVPRVAVLKTYVWLQERELPMTAQKVSRSNTARKDAALLDFILTLLTQTGLLDVAPLLMKKRMPRWNRYQENSAL